MNIDDLIQYVSQEGVLIGMQLKSRAFLLVQLRYINPSNYRHIKKINAEAPIWQLIGSIMNMCTNNDLFILNYFLNATEFDYDRMFRLQIGAIFLDHDDFIAQMNEWNVNFWEVKFEGACRGGHRDLAEWIISKGLNSIDFDMGFYVTCQGNSVGHRDLVEMLIEKGADNWNAGLHGACQGDSIVQQDLVKLMILKGASICYKCHKSMQEHLESKN